MEGVRNIPKPGYYVDMFDDIVIIYPNNQYDVFEGGIWCSWHRWVRYTDLEQASHQYSIYINSLEYIGEL